MKKVFCAMLIFCLIFFTACNTQYVGEKPNETKEQESIETVVETTEKEIENKKEEILENTSDTKDIVVSQKYKIEDLEKVDKELVVYGDIIKDTDTIKEKLSSYNKNISVAVYSLDGEFGLVYNTNQTYFSACTIKIAYVLSCCKQIDEGIESKDTILTYQQKHYHGGSGQIKNQPYGTTYTIETLINKCLSISDNVAYEMLVDHFGYDYYNKMVRDLGCESIKLSGLWASRAKTLDFIRVWTAVNEYFKSETTMSNVLKKACTNTPFNYGTKTIKEFDYSHKSGDNFGVSAAYNDAGIVWCEKPYVYVVFTNSEGTYYDAETVNTVMRSIFDNINSAVDIDKTEKILYN